MVPVITKMEVYPVAGHDCMELNPEKCISFFIYRLRATGRADSKAVMENQMAFIIANIVL